MSIRENKLRLFQRFTRPGGGKADAGSPEDRQVARLAQNFQRIVTWAEGAQDFWVMKNHPSLPNHTPYEIGTLIVSGGHLYIKQSAGWKQLQEVP